VYIQGSSFHRYDRKAMREEVRKAQQEGSILTHFGPEGNHLDKLETLFSQYASDGTGMSRYYLHTPEAACERGQAPGTFTPWEPLETDSDLLLYRGLHGAALAGDVDIAQYPDLHIGIAPNANLEWMRKIQRDTRLRGYSKEEVQQSILARLHDYVHHITPQFSRTHINFQMVPVVDTSDPFGGGEAPNSDECFLVICFKRKIEPDFVHLLDAIPGAQMSRRNTMVVPGSKILLAIEVILMPLIHDLVLNSRALRNIVDVPEDRGAGLLGLPSDPL